MDDLISRQAAIDALIEWYGCEPSDIGAFKDIIEKMPSVERSKSTDIRMSWMCWSSCHPLSQKSYGVRTASIITHSTKFAGIAQNTIL